MNFKTPGILYKKNDDTLKTEVIVNRLRHNVFGVTLTDNFQYQQWDQVIKKYPNYRHTLKNMWLWL